MQDNLLNQRHLNDALLTANARIAELEAENEQLAIPFAKNNLMDLVRVNHDVYNSLKHREAELYRLKAKLETKEMDYTVLQESHINSEINLETLQAHGKEAMELLGLAVADAEYLAYLVKNAGEKCNNCSKSDKSCFQSSDCWRWQHADRYEALKAQTKKQISEEKIYDEAHN